MQFLSDVYRRTEAIGTDLGSVGVKSIAAAAVTTSSQRDTAQKSFGFYAQGADRLARPALRAPPPCAWTTTPRSGRS